MIEINTLDTFIENEQMQLLNAVSGKQKGRN